MSEAGELAGARAVVTGGAGGIGRATARRFLAAGARVVIADIDADRVAAVARELDPEATRVRAVQCDISDPDRCAALVGDAEVFLGGPLDVFLANAGLAFSGSLLEADPREIRRVVDVNVTGSILSSQAALRSLVGSPHGCLLFTASLQSVAGRAERSVYTATKHAVAGLVKALALEFGPQGVRVNGIAPTIIDTPFLRGTYERLGLDVEAGIARAAAGLPLGRIPTVEDFAEVATFLASPAARAITGHVLMVDCGATAGSFSPPQRTSSAPSRPGA